VQDSKSKIRLEIEGLRALSVLGVLIFHLDKDWLPGGFVGVDAFFVISGYLISKSLLNSFEKKTFSFRRFYIKRIRRLMPALFLTALGAYIFAYFLLSPVDLKAMAGSMMAALFGFGNIHFYLSVNYFNSLSFNHPLLHTWSLGVEEQFYFVWPLLLYLVHKNRFFKKIPKAIVFLILFLPVPYFYANIPSGAFYLMPFRAFQFFLGFWVLRVENKVRGSIPMGAGLLASLSLGVLLASFVFLNESYQWPGFYTLIPSLAVGGVIVFTKNTFLYPILGNSILSYFGRISYSLYLVHWPVIVLYRYYLIVPPSVGELLGLGVLSVLLGDLLFRLAEAPFSSKGEGPRKNRLNNILKTPYILGGLVSLGLVGLMTVVSHGFPGRFKKAKITEKGYLTFAGDVCSSDTNRCILGDRKSSKNVYLVGDSFAMNLFYGLDKLFAENNLKLTVLYDHGCLYLRYAKTYSKSTLDKKCNSNVKFSFDSIERSNDPVLLVVNWEGYQTKVGKNFSKTADYGKWLKEEVLKSLDFLSSSQKVLVFLSSYSTGPDLSRCLLKDSLSKNCRPLTLDENFKKFRDIDTYLKKVSNGSNTFVLDPKAGFCFEGKCTIQGPNNELYLRDTAHLTNEGSSFLIKNLGTKILDFVN